ncbi:ATP-binding protein [Streptomyces sp. NPDC056632]|uniref:ATP-binding protein n=1 Tax=Streptomyces sp. NPDC056632 TaxID=3345884 RepID=UPI0036C894E3
MVPFGQVWAGREEQTGSLRNLVRAVADGHGGSVLVEGEPGAGKSALLAGVAEEAGRLGCRVVEGAADELGQRFPLGAVLDCLDDSESGAPRRARVVASLYDGGARSASTHDPLAAATEELIRQVDDWCAASPVVLIMDNLQWADEGSLRVWQRLDETARDKPLLLVGASRAGADGDRLAALRASVSAHGALLTLAEFTEEETARLVTDTLGAAPTPRLLRRLAGAGGNPYYIRELLATLVRHGAVDTSSGRAELATEGAADDEPPLAPASLTERLQFLTPQALHVLRTAALLGSDFTFRELSGLLESDRDELWNHVDELKSAAVIDESRGQLRFRHQMLRESLYGSLPGSVRSAMHVQAAKVLEREGAMPRRVAQQLLPVLEQPDAWTVSWVVRNISALVHRAPGVAVELAGRVLDRLPPGSADAEHLRGTVVTGTALLRRPGAAEQVRALRDRTKNVEYQAELTFLLVLGLMQEGRIPEGLAEVDEALKRYADVPATELTFLGLRSFLVWAFHRFDEAEEVARRVVERTRTLACPTGEAYARYTLGHLALRGRDYQTSLREIETGIEVAEDSDDTVELRIGMLLMGSYVSAVIERVDHAARLLDRARTLSQHSPGRRPWVHVVAAWFKYRIGQWDEALDDLHIDPGQPMPTDPWLPIMMRGISALIEAARDRWDSVDEHMDAVAGVHLDPHIPHNQASHLLLTRSLTAERTGNQTEALDLLLPTLDPELAASLDNRYQWMPDIVRLALAVGETAHALAAVEAADMEAERVPEDGYRRAAAQRSRGLFETDPEPLTAALAYCERLGYLPFLGHTHEDLAAVHAQKGDPDSARVHLQRAVAVYQALGAQWYVARADARLRALGVRRGHRRAGPASRTKSGWDSLTPAEVKVALLVAKGLSNPQIAAELLLSPRTVQTHVSHILGKLGMRSRTDIAREAAGRARDTRP